MIRRDQIVKVLNFGLAKLASGWLEQVANNTKLSVFVRYPTWSLPGNQIVFEYAEVKGNTWITDLE